MDRTNAAGSTADHKFTEGNKAGGVPATVVSAEWLNNVQEEICNLIELNGVALDPNDQTQLFTLIASLLSAKANSSHDHNATYYTQGQVASLLLGKSDTSHNHDGSYYLKSAVDSLLLGKSDTSHIHDSRYYTQAQVNAMFAGLNHEDLGIFVGEVWSTSIAISLPANWTLSQATSGGGYILYRITHNLGTNAYQVAPNIIELDTMYGLVDTVARTYAKEPNYFDIIVVRQGTSTTYNNVKLSFTLTMNS